MERDIDARLAEPAFRDGEREIVESMKNTICSIRVWHRRYLDSLKEKKPAVYEILRTVPFEQAQNFCEAVQSLWFTFAFTRLCGNWPGIGRIDEMLGEYLRRDLQNGALTLDAARELLAHFFIKGCEWIRSDTSAGSGDAAALPKHCTGGRQQEWARGRK